MLSKRIREILPEFLVLNILEHEFNRLNDPLCIVSFYLSIIKFLHVVMFRARESQLLCFVSCALMLYHSKAAHHINRTTFINIETILLIVSVNQFQNPSKHGQVLYLFEHCDEIVLTNRKSGIELCFCIETMHQLFILIDKLFNISLHIVPGDIL